MTSKNKQKATEQLNLRVPKDLLDDLDKIAAILKVNKSEWIKIKLSEIVYSEKSRLVDKYADLNNRGIINKKELDKLVK